MLILLDIDGVMVHAKSWVSLPILDDGFYAFNKMAVNALNAIIEKSDAEIVLTTSHKYSFSLDKWVDIFKNRGVNISSINRLEPHHGRLSRHDEIVNWFAKNNNVTNFLIIDDDKTLNGLSSALQSRLIQTLPLVGLTKSHIKDAIGILATPMKQTTFS